MASFERVNEAALDELELGFARRGLRLTRGRREVIRAIVGLGRHFGAEDALRALAGRASKATVYRCLGLLVECGLVRRVRLGDEGGWKYERVATGEHHDHIVCLRCGKVIEFRDDEIERLQQEVCRRHGFRAVGHKMRIAGYCRECE